MIYLCLAFDPEEGFNDRLSMCGELRVAPRNKRERNDFE